MWFISGEEYNQLIQGATELERDRHGVKVLITPDKHIVKLIRVKRWLSLSAIYPYTVRFMRNAKRLVDMGVPCVDVERVFYCHNIRRHGVIYPLLEGTSLEKISQNDGLSDSLFQKLAEFIAMLHRKGIYFRSLHPGNILLLPNGEFGLIDVADMRFSSGALRIDQRKRNFRHLFRTQLHRDVFTKFGIENFLKLYSKAAGLNQKQTERISSLGELGSL